MKLLRYRWLIAALGLTLSPAWAASTDRPDSQQEYWAQFDQRDWSAAIEAAEALVAAARAEPDEPHALAETLSLLGNAHLGAGDYVSAEAAYGEALQLAEAFGGVMSAAQLDPLRGLGYTYAASGRHAEAAPLLDRALIVARRNFGLFDPGQQGVLRQLAASLTKLGRGEEAERHMLYLLRIAQQTYGRSDPKLVPTLCIVGEWYARTGNFGVARETYRRAIDIVERKLGRSNMAAVEPLQGLARTYTQELFYSTLGLRTSRARTSMPSEDAGAERQAINPRYLSSEGEKALDHALRILDAAPNPPLEMHVETLIQAGDWRQIKHEPDEALPFYRRAAALLHSHSVAAPGETERKDERSALLQFPVRLYYPAPRLAARNLTLSEELAEETFVEIEFTVTQDGSVRDARIVDSNGGGRQEAETLEAVSAARYRPRFENGEPVDTEAVKDRQVFKSRRSGDRESE